MVVTNESQPTTEQCVALLELLREAGGPLGWTGPIPYGALAARHRAEKPAEQPEEQPAEQPAEPINRRPVAA